MRKQTVAILCCYLVLFNGALFGAFPSTTNIDVRTTATAGNVNGGAFVPATGTKVVTGATDLAIDSTNNKKVTSASHNFVAGDVNRYIQITAGTNWTLGNYQILSVASNAAILELSPGPTSLTGGTYDLYSGIDYTQQDAAQVAYTDIVVGGTTTQGTSVLNPFTTSMEGNTVNVISGAGCTVQRAYIVSVSGTTATFDRTLGTAASVCTGNLGGAYLTVGAAEALNVGNVFVKSGTYIVTTTITNSASGLLQGYGTNHHDGGTKPLITTATNSVDLITFNSNIVVQNLSLSNTAGTRKAGLLCGSNFNIASINNVIFDGFTYAFLGDNGSFGFACGMLMSRSEIKNSTTGGVFAFFQLVVQGSYFHNNTGTCIAKSSTQNQTYSVTDSIIASCTNGLDPVNGSGMLVSVNNAFVSNTQSGINNSALGIFINNIFYGNTQWGIDGIPTGVWISNAFGSNTSGDVHTTVVNQNTITNNRINLTANPFVSSTNFALNNTAGGGALLRQTGYPGIFQGATTTGYLDVGPTQTSGAPGGGGAFNGAFAQ